MLQRGLDSCFFLKAKGKLDKPNKADYVMKHLEFSEGCSNRQFICFDLATKAVITETVAQIWKSTDNGQQSNTPRSTETSFFVSARTQ